MWHLGRRDRIEERLEHCSGAIGESDLEALRIGKTVGFVQLKVVGFEIQTARTLMSGQAKKWQALVKANV